MPFERVILKRTGGGNPVPHLTVTTSGTLRMNRAAQLAFGLDQYSHATFHVDEETNRLGLGLQSDADGADGKIKRDKDGSGYGISAATLIKQLGMKPGSYPLAVDEESGLLNITFDKAEGEEVASAATVKPARQRAKKAA